MIEPARYSNQLLAIQLICKDGEPLGRLSVKPPHDRTLPPNCFYVKDWSENEEISYEAAASGWFKARPDINPEICGFELACVWELLEVKGEPFNPDEIVG